MKRKILFLTLLVLSVSVLFTSCNDDKKSDNQVAVLLKNPSNNWRKALSYYAEKSLKENSLINVAFVRNATNGTEQAKQLKEAYDSGCRIIILSPEGIDKKIISEYIDKGAKFILSEEELVDNYTSFVYTDNATVGANAAQFMIQKGAKKIALFQVQQDQASSNGRINGFLNKVQTSGPGIETQQFELVLYTREEGKQVALNVLDDGSFDAIYAQDDEIAQGVMDAIAERESSAIKVVIGCGGSQDFFKLIDKTKTLSLATTLYSPSMIGKCVDIAALILKGSHVDKKYALESYRYQFRKRVAILRFKFTVLITIVLLTLV